MIDVVQEYGSPYIRPSFCLPQDCRVSNIRFNGNYSKFELLHMAMTVSGAGVYTLDLEDCTNLDDECLEAILKCKREHCFSKELHSIKTARFWKILTVNWKKYQITGM